MWKRSLVLFTLIFILSIGFIAFNNKNKNTESKKSKENIVNDETEISSTLIMDDCINEWKDYSLTVQEEIKEASQSILDENKLYIIKSEDNYIKVYYINNKNEEILYKVTDIAIQYLGKEDVDKLKQGIKVKGIQELNQLLEDFE